MRLAVLLTSFNRKEFTLNAIKLIKEQKNHDIHYQIYLTDDNSTDGTSEEVASQYPDVVVLRGNGSLFWAGGMRNSWRAALKKDYDAYLLLNDDTFIFKDLFQNLKMSMDYMLKEFGKNGILIGSTKNKESSKFTYGGSIYTNKFKATYKQIVPTSHHQSCELGNANIMLVHKDVVNAIGILNKNYTHGVADYDYTFTAVKSEIPVIVMPNYQGSCSAHEVSKSEIFLKIKSLRKRYQYLMSPIGLAFKDNVYYQFRHFPYRLFFTIPSTFLRLMFPKFYLTLSENFLNRKNG